MPTCRVGYYASVLEAVAAAGYLRQVLLERPDLERPRPPGLEGAGQRVRPAHRRDHGDVANDGRAADPPLVGARAATARRVDDEAAPRGSSRCRARWAGRRRRSCGRARHGTPGPREQPPGPVRGDEVVAQGREAARDPDQRALVGVLDADEDRARRAAGESSAPSFALAKATPRSGSMPMTSPVLRISGPRMMSVPWKRLNGKTGSFTEKYGGITSSGTPELVERLARHDAGARCARAARRSPCSRRGSSGWRADSPRSGRRGCPSPRTGRSSGRARRGRRPASACSRGSPRRPASLRLKVGSVQHESPEWTPASSMCSMMPPMMQRVPSETASTSTSIASSRNLSMRIGLLGRRLDGLLHVALEHLVVVDDLHGPAAEHEGRPHQDGVPDPVGDLEGVLVVRGRPVRRLAQPAALDEVLEAPAVAREVDGVGRRPDDRRAGQLQVARQVQRASARRTARSRPSGSVRSMMSSTCSVVSGSKNSTSLVS